MTGIEVWVCDELGERMTTPLPIDWTDERERWVSKLIPPLSDVHSTCWRFIDPYGDTYFNRLQLPSFIEELEGLMTLATPAQQGRLLEIKAHAEFALALPHRYLRFCGD